MARTRRVIALTLTAVFALSVSSVTAQEMGEHALTVTNNAGAEGSLMAENAVLERHEDGITLTVTMPTPVANEYKYPPKKILDKKFRAQPEVFSGWAFVFNDPAACTANAEPPRCSFGDDAMVKQFAGQTNSLSYNGGVAEPGDLAVNAASDGMLVMSGNVGSEFVTNPMGAEVMVVITPHGQVRGHKMVEMFQPFGSPDCNCWWLANFGPGMEQMTTE